MTKIKPSNVLQFNKGEVIRSVRCLLFHNRLNKKMLREILMEFDIRENYLRNSNLVGTREYRESLGLSREKFWSIIPYNAVSLDEKSPEELLEEVKEALKIKDTEEEIIKILVYVNNVIKTYNKRYIGRTEFNQFKYQFYTFKHTFLFEYIKKHKENVILFLETNTDNNDKYLSVELSDNLFSLHIPWTIAKKNIEISEYDLPTREYKRLEVDEDLKIVGEDYFNKVFILSSYFNVTHER